LGRTIPSGNAATAADEGTADPATLPQDRDRDGASGDMARGRARRAANSVRPETPSLCGKRDRIAPDRVRPFAHR
jgi:hypothetical protein